MTQDATTDSATQATATTTSSEGQGQASQTAAPVAEQSAPAAAPQAPAAPAPVAQVTAPEAPLEYKFDVPEGAQLDQEMLNEFTEYAKGKRLHPEQANDVVKMGLKLQSKFAEASLKAYTEQVSKWVQDCKTDQLVGGQDFDRKCAIAKQALHAFGDSELEQVLRPYHATENPKGLGLGNHPALLRWAYRVARSRATEESFIPGGVSTTSNENEVIGRLYPSMAKA